MPTVWLGELAYKSVEQSDANNLRDFVRDEDPNQVRSLNLRCCNLGDLGDRAFMLLVESISRLESLQVLKVNDCNLSSYRLGMIMRAVKNHVHFTTAENGTNARIYVGGNSTTDTKFLDSCGKLHGVGTFSITGVCIGDDSVISIAETFPLLGQLYLSGTNVSCKGIAAIVRSLKNLSILGLDSTPCAEIGTSQILTAMRERSMDPLSEGIEVWLRNVPAPTTAWQELLKFIACNSAKFVLKHDMQNEICSFPRHAIASHSNITVSVYINGHEPFVVNYGKALCSKAVHAIATDAISELNLFLMCDERDVKDRVIMARKTAFREAFSRLFVGSQFKNKQYTTGAVQFKKIDRYTGNVEMRYAISKDLLGKKSARCNYVIEVEAQEM